MRRSSGRSRQPSPQDSADRAAAGPPGDPEQVARLICLRQLEASPRTRAELASTLARRGIPDEAAEHVLARLVEVGMIDDPLFAQMWVESRQQGKHLSRRALRAELGRRGVAAPVINEALEGVTDEDEHAAALALARRKAAGMRGLDPVVQTRRLAGALARKGYSSGLSHAVVREVLAEQDVEIDEPA